MSVDLGFPSSKRARTAGGPVVALALALGLALASPVTAGVPTSFVEAFAEYQAREPEAAGDPIESISQVWLSNAVGLAFDAFDPTGVWHFHEPANSTNPSASGIWRVAAGSPHTATALTYTKRGGQDVDGGSVRSWDGVIFASDLNGDNVHIGDNIYAFARTGQTLAFWETDDGLAGSPCTGFIVDQILDIAVDPRAPRFVYATTAQENKVYRINLSNTSGGASSTSPCQVVARVTPTALITNVAGIEYDPCNHGFWLSDLASGKIVLVADDGTFKTVLAQLTASLSSPPSNSGVSPLPASAGAPLALWSNALGSGASAVWDSGRSDCSFQPIFADSFESGGTTAWSLGP